MSMHLDLEEAYFTQRLISCQKVKEKDHYHHPMINTYLHSWHIFHSSVCVCLSELFSWIVQVMPPYIGRIHLYYLYFPLLYSIYGHYQLLCRDENQSIEHWYLIHIYRMICWLFGVFGISYSLGVTSELNHFLSIGQHTMWEQYRDMWDK